MGRARQSRSASKLRLCQKPIVADLRGDKSRTVFISYSQRQNDFDKHRDWVAFLARKLSGLGIVTLSDLNWNGSKTLKEFMRDGIQNSQYVICVCSDSYVKKTRDKSQTGVRREYRYILKRDRIQKLKQFVMPILIENSIENFPERVPERFASLRCWNFETEQKAKGEFAALVARILEIEETIKNIASNRSNRDDYDSIFQKMSDKFYDVVAQYWCAKLDSSEEGKLCVKITSGDIFKLPDEKNSETSSNNFDVRHNEKMLISMGRWNNSYSGDQEILSLLSEVSTNEQQ